MSFEISRWGLLVYLFAFYLRVFFVGSVEAFLLYPQGGAAFPFGARPGVVVFSFAVLLPKKGLQVGFGDCWCHLGSSFRLLIPAQVWINTRVSEPRNRKVSRW